MNNKLLIGMVVLVVIIGIIVLLGEGKKETKPTARPNPIPSEIAHLFPKKPYKPTAKTTIVVNASGISPASITIKTGTEVTWDNKSGADISINSDDHPTHRLFMEVNLGDISINTSKHVLFEKPGTFTYHNHYKPEMTGTIIVE